jgi:hypothetical protein
VSDTSVSANSTATATLTIYTSETTCDSLSSSAKKRTFHTFVPGKGATAKADPTPLSRRAVPVGAEAVLAGFLIVGLRRRRSAIWTILSAIVVAAALGLATGCGSSGSSSSTSTDVAKGTYTVTLDGTDASDSSIAASTTFTLTVD